MWGKWYRVRCSILTIRSLFVPTTHNTQPRTSIILSRQLLGEFMIHRWAAPALGLLVCGLFATRAASQVPNQRADSNRRWGTLRQNQPNPFANETTIPFSVGDAGCSRHATR